MPQVRQLAFADCRIVVAHQGRINGNVQGNNGVATSRRGFLNRDGFFASFGKCHTMPCVGQLAFANRRIIVALHRRAHCHMQGNDTVTTLYGGIRNSNGLGASFVECHAVPCERQLGFANRCVIVTFQHGIHRQVQSHNAVAARCRGIRKRNDLGAGLVEGYTIPCVR